MLRPFAQVTRIPDERRILHNHQRAFLSYRGTLRTNCAGRRSGKTFATLLWLVEQWRARPGQLSIFCATSAEQAVWIGWETFRSLNERFRWGFTPNQGTQSWKAPNGFTLRFCGAKDKNEANRLRGIPKIHRLALDEAGLWADILLKYTWEACLRPMLIDTGGEAVICGTPNPSGVGYYENLMRRCEAVGAHFHWTIRDNPHLNQSGEESLSEVLREEFGGDATNITFRREYLGERVADSGAIIYQHGQEIWQPDAPTSRNYTAMGVDLGWHDGLGLCVVRSRAPLEGVHICEALAESYVTIDRTAALIERMRAEWRVADIFVDTAGGGGATICGTLAQQYALPALPVRKIGLRAQIEQVRAMLASHTLTMSREKASILADEWAALTWDDDHKGHREGYADEATNALQYALTGPGFVRRSSWNAQPSPDEIRAREEDAARARAMKRRVGRR